MRKIAVMGLLFCTLFVGCGQGTTNNYSYVSEENDELTPEESELKEKIYGIWCPKEDEDSDVDYYYVFSSEGITTILINYTQSTSCPSCIVSTDDYEFTSFEGATAIDVLDAFWKDYSYLFDYDCFCFKGDILYRHKKNVDGDGKAMEEKRVSEDADYYKLGLYVPEIGMTGLEVKNSLWGMPTKVNKTTTKYGVSEQYCYPDNHYVYLEDDVVTSIQE